MLLENWLVKNSECQSGWKGSIWRSSSLMNGSTQSNRNNDLQNIIFENNLQRTTFLLTYHSRCSCIRVLCNTSLTERSRIFEILGPSKNCPRKMFSVNVNANLGKTWYEIFEGKRQQLFKTVNADLCMKGSTDQLKTQIFKRRERTSLEGCSKILVPTLRIMHSLIGKSVFLFSRGSTFTSLKKYVSLWPGWLPVRQSGRRRKEGFRRSSCMKIDLWFDLSFRAGQK